MPVLDTRSFEDVLVREKARAELAIADGKSDSFCTVVFDDNVGRWLQETPRADANSTFGPLRISDTIGWFAPQLPGLILPHTKLETANAIVDRIVESLPMDSVRYEIQEHPKKASAEAATLEDAVSIADAMPWWKRAMDVLGAMALLILLSPLLFVVMAAVKLTSKGPIFFRQTRAGLGARPFTMLKFRSMVVNAEELKEGLRAQNEVTGPVFKIEKDPRITRIGRWIRKSSIDELPQLWNVLVGDMSLVGPRPPTFDEVEKYTPWQRRRLDITPGLTCFWQVGGRSKIDFDEWVRLDLKYAEERSVWTDLKLLFLTVPAVLSMRGAH